MEATLGSMGLSWGQWDSVEIVRVQLGLSGGSVVLNGSLWGSVGLSGGTVVYSGAQWGSVRNVYTPLINETYKQNSINKSRQ